MIDFPNFSENSHSLLSKFLTKSVFEELKNKKTTKNNSLQQVIASGVAHQDSHIGVYAGDKESYTIFSSLFDPIIKEYHGFSKHQKHNSNTDITQFSGSNPDVENKYIISTRIRVARNIANYPLGTIISNEERKEVEKRIVSALCELKNELSGSYYPLYNMPQKTQAQLIEDHFLFKEGDRFLSSAGLNNDWPNGRGIFHNKEKTFLVWVNEEDQLRIISMQKGGNIKEVFARLIKAVKEIEKVITFSKSDRLGYITSCPTNLGTAMRASVHIFLPKLSADMKKLKSITNHHHLQIRGVNGEHSESKNSVFDISNQRRLGVTEIEAINDLYKGITALIKAEKEKI